MAYRLSYKVEGAPRFNIAHYEKKALAMNLAQVLKRRLERAEATLEGIEKLLNFDVKVYDLANQSQVVRIDGLTKFDPATLLKLEE